MEPFEKLLPVVQTVIKKWLLCSTNRNKEFINKNRLIYHPDEVPVMHESFEHYKSNKGHTINHFHEKLLLLKDRMNTESAKNIAKQRHLFMKEYLDRFYKEWNGDA